MIPLRYPLKLLPSDSLYRFLHELYQICKIAEKENIDVIVMGRRGMSQLKRYAVVRAPHS